MRLPRWLAATLLVCILLGAGLYWLSRPPESITVVSWGDTYGRAQTLALFHPYTDKTHVDVRVANYGGGLKEISAQVASGDIEWDVVDLELEDAASACRQGLLERLDGIELPPGANGEPAQRDFVPGALGPCWVGSMVYSQVIAFDSTSFPGTAPSKLTDFFDVARFPGPRGLRDGPKYNLELALMADGEPAWRVYAVLATEAGLTRAFAKLDAIKPSILWWRRAAEPGRDAGPGAGGDDDRAERARLQHRRRAEDPHHLGRPALSTRRVRDSQRRRQEEAGARFHSLRHGPRASRRASALSPLWSGTAFIACARSPQSGNECGYAAEPAYRAAEFRPRARRRSRLVGKTRP